MRSATSRPAPLPLRAAARVIRTLPLGRYRAAGWVAACVREPFRASLPADLGSMAFQCDLRDGLMREAYLTGRYEPQETALVSQLLLPGMTFADVGANWGYFTLVAAHLTGPSGRVLAVEADPRAVSAIRANVAVNRLTTVRVFDVAATDFARDLTFARYEPARSTVSANYGVAQTEATTGTADVIVPGRRLDDLFEEAGVGLIDVLKMDIEGGEAAALAGLGRFLAAGRVDCILLELHPAALLHLGSSTSAVCERLLSAGYDGWHIDHSPRSHYRASAGPVEPLLTPLDLAADFGRWPNLLWRRRLASR